MGSNLPSVLEYGELFLKNGVLYAGEGEGVAPIVVGGQAVGGGLPDLTDYALKTYVDTETSRAQGVESSLTSSLSAEVTRAQAAEASLLASIGSGNGGSGNGSFTKNILLSVRTSNISSTANIPSGSLITNVTTFIEDTYLEGISYNYNIGSDGNDYPVYDNGTTTLQRYNPSSGYSLMTPRTAPENIKIVLSGGGYIGISGNIYDNDFNILANIPNIISANVY